MSIRSISNSATQYFVIDKSTRTITAPAGFKNFGVESDENSNRVYFQCPRYVGDNLDLATLNIRVNFQNANKEKDQYIVTDVAIDGENIRFSWVLSRKATAYKGSISFIICAVKTNAQGVITNEWNTTLATGAVLSGLEVEIPEIPEEVTDVVNQLLDIVDTAKSDMEAATAEGMANIKTAENQAIEAVLNTPNSLMANAIKGSASGEIIAVHDVSPLEHTVNVKVQSKNLCNFSSTGEKNGLIYSYNNGVWDIQGTPTIAYAGIESVAITNQLEDGESYTISQSQYFESSAASGAVYLQVLIEGYNGEQSFVLSAVGARTFTVDKTKYKRYILTLQCGTAMQEVSVSNFTVQLEKGETATEYTPYVSPENVTLTRCGKNLSPKSSVTITGEVGATGAIGGLPDTILVKDVPIVNGATYIVSLVKPVEIDQPRVFLYNEKLTSQRHTAAYNELITEGRGIEKTVFGGAITNSENYEYLAISTGNGSTYTEGMVEINITDIQIELGNIVTNYEPYSEAEYTPNVDGTANVTSLAPNMTLFTDTNGVNIECEYNKDSNVVIQELIERIATLENQGS